MRKLFNILFDLFTGFKLDSRTKELLAMDKWSREEIEAYQQKMFEKLKSYAGRSEIYKGCKDWTISDFPKYSKDFYRDNHEKFLTRFRKPFRIESTSGSTGTPRNIVVSKEMILAKRASHLKMLAWEGIKREEREIYIGGLTKSWMYKIYYRLKNKYFLSSYNITKGKAEEYILKINRLKPSMIFTYPYAIDLILNVAEEKKLKIYQPKLIYTGAENLYPHIEEKIRKHFPSSALANEYWSTEGNIAVTCPNGSMHIDEDTLIVETDNMDNNGVGDIIITNLFSYDLPLIRYRLGDRIKLSEQKCGCGRNTRIIEKILGRDIDYFVLPDGRKIAYTENSIQIAQMSENVISYQVIYRKSDHSLLFKFVKKDKTKPVQNQRISEYFRVSFNLDILFEEVDFIETDSSGKFKIFKSE